MVIGAGLRAAIERPKTFDSMKPERKRTRTAKHEISETTSLVWFKQVRSQNSPLSGSLILERNNELFKQMGITLSDNPEWLERFQKRNDTVQGTGGASILKIKDNMLTKYQMVKFKDFCEVWFLPESVARVATIVGDHRCHTPRH
ncbi:hypothetical protein TNCV_3605021 [Trichonephila clavipes]|nr:hypothetical protein TNCV_3605021 [Trichonephila clavipes]